MPRRQAGRQAGRQAEARRLHEAAPGSAGGSNRSASTVADCVVVARLRSVELKHLQRRVRGVVAREAGRRGRSNDAATRRRGRLQRKTMGDDEKRANAAAQGRDGRAEGRQRTIAGARGDAIDHHERVGEGKGERGGRGTRTIPMLKKSTSRGWEMAKGRGRKRGDRSGNQGRRQGLALGKSLDALGSFNALPSAVQ